MCRNHELWDSDVSLFDAVAYTNHARREARDRTSFCIEHVVRISNDLPFYLDGDVMYWMKKKNTNKTDCRGLLSNLQLTRLCKYIKPRRSFDFQGLS